MPHPSYIVSTKGDADSLAEQIGFSLYSGITYDRYTGAFGIGYQSTYPEALARKIIAADLATFMGVSSRTAEKYLKETPYTRSARFDANFQRRLIDRVEDKIPTLIEINLMRDSHVGEAAGDSAFASAVSIWKEAFKLADRGTLFEVMALARLSFETLAWVCRAVKTSDGAELLAIKAQASIGALKDLISFSGKFYGWLSEHTHWHPSAHVKSFKAGEEQLLTLTHCVDYKVQSYATLTVLAYSLELVLSSIIEARGGNVARPTTTIYLENLDELNEVAVKIVDDRHGALGALATLSSFLKQPEID